ncbi:hypothetical protein BIY24_07575 [Halobacteriovorax marinus]|uniref:phosphoribosylglycinamide formyltransferase n=1 Tax=Halobacteriovorax marinus TaxID=97084 RepID=UPI000BC31F85|nr:phosphoribosylglycinamide formyltransferase [Halobacteriovorax marinus]ATH07812.1 hypothetical protein BIY24_07575 [Halobacteriovorax marinus]
MDSVRNIAIFASGRGTNALNIVNFVEQNCSGLRVVCLICDLDDAPVLNLLRGRGVDLRVISSKGLSKEEHEQRIWSALDSFNIDWILLAGYMRILSKEFIAKGIPIVNIHPSLLPLYPGLHSYKKSFESRDEFSGATIHLVDEGVDTGAIILQKKFPRLRSDSFDQFRRRGLENEYELYRLFLYFLNKSDSKVYSLINYFTGEKRDEHLSSGGLSKGL